MKHIFRSIPHTFAFGLSLLLGLPLFDSALLAEKQHKTANKQKNRQKIEPQRKCFKHNIQLQLADAQGFPVPDTEFWVTVDVIRQGSLVTIQVPLINFQVGQCSIDDPICPTFVPGGYLYTSAGFLPEELRPTSLVPQSILAASNNGLSPVFSFTQDPATIPQPPAGYIVQITNAGALQVQCAGTVGNAIPEGPNILMPCSITYKVEKQEQLCKNFVLSNGATNITQFTNEFANAGNNFRDSHVNAAFDGVVAWAWTDNSMVADKSNGTLNVMVSVGTVDSCGNLTVGEPIQLTDLPPIVMAWGTAVAIVKDGPNKGNIVVSYNVFDYTQLRVEPGKIRINFCSCHAVSKDGGKTWLGTPYEYTSFYGSLSNESNDPGNILQVTDVVFGTLAAGQTIYTYTASRPDPGIIPETIITSQLMPLLPGESVGGIGRYTVSGEAQLTGPNYIVAFPPSILIPMQPSNSIGSGDARGVLADKFGNVWYGATIALPNGLPPEPYANLPIFTVSTDGGVSFSTTPIKPIPLPDPLPPITLLYDFPQYCFGGRGDGSNDYGLWFSVDFWENGIDSNPIVGFIPIYGLGSFGDPTIINLTSLTNVYLIPSMAAAEDGRVWTQCIPYSASTYIAPICTLFKSPGEIDSNYAGTWNVAMINQSNLQWGITNSISNPFWGYFNTVQGNLYDEKRKALYAIVTYQVPDYSQDMNIYFVISRDNGMTWSPPLQINSTSFANRGYASMALDPVTGDVLFGFYDGRNDKTFESVEYFGAVLPASKLDTLVNAIPLSNPTFIVPPATTPPPGNAVGTKTQSSSLNSAMMKRFENRFGRRHLKELLK